MKCICQREVGGHLVTEILSGYQVCELYAYADCSGESIKAVFWIDNEKAGTFVPCQISKNQSYVDEETGIGYTVYGIAPKEDK